MKRTFYYNERRKQSNLYKTGFFGSARNGGLWTILDDDGNKTGVATDLDFILVPDDSKANMFAPIRHDALDYFNRYDISWWRQDEDGYFPTGHMVSSQNHCLNHLFALRRDKDAVKLIIENATGMQFDEVLPSLIDEDPESYISFEFAFHNIEWLKEDDEGSRRGTMCTSIDVMIFARKGNRKWLIPIEWKYTETYNGKDKTNAKRMDRYAHLIESSKRLKRPEHGVAHSIYFVEPSYELMRQTLLCEQIVLHKFADDFFHINVIPRRHYELRNAVEKEFIPMLEDKSKFKIVDPEELLSPLNGNMAYDELLKYLQKRYWGSVK